MVQQRWEPLLRLPPHADVDAGDAPHQRLAVEGERRPSSDDGRARRRGTDALDGSALGFDVVGVQVGHAHLHVSERHTHHVGSERANRFFERIEGPIPMEIHIEERDIVPLEPARDPGQPQWVHQFHVDSGEGLDQEDAHPISPGGAPVYLAKTARGLEIHLSFWISTGVPSGKDSSSHVTNSRAGPVATGSKADPMETCVQSKQRRFRRCPGDPHTKSNASFTV